MSIGLGTFTVVHVLISLVGIAAGLFAVAGWLNSDPARTPTVIFLASTILTSVTGFFFPFTKLLPSHVVGILSLVLLIVATFALYAKHTSGIWRPIYTITAMLALYLNIFVLIIQSFLKVPILKSLAPTQTESPFIAVQAVVFLLLIVLTALTTRRFRPSRPLGLNSVPLGSNSPS